MEAHAKKYSPGYKRDLEKGTSWTFWAKDFDAIAYKTMLRQLISKWGIMSIDLQDAIDSDMAVIREDGSRDYVETVQPDAVEEAAVPQEESAAVQEDDAAQETNDAAADFFS